MHELEKALKDSFADSRMSSSEKVALRSLFDDYKHNQEALSFARNQAFEMCRDYFLNNKFDTKAYKWLEEIVKSIDVIRNAFISVNKNEVYFSPGEACRDRIIELLNEARQQIDICVFTISDNLISQAIYDAHQRKVKVRIVTDNDKSEDLGSDIDRLKGEGVPVVFDHYNSHMHHKFAIVDNKYLINGSFNWTRSATSVNNENITVLSDQYLVSEFAGKFNSLWRQFKK